MPEPSIGAQLEVPTGRGTCKFVGNTSFAPGRWIGIELFEPAGKNDGTVQGVEYFRCKPNYGVFVRASQVKIIEQTHNRRSSGLGVPAPSATNLSRSNSIRSSAVTPTSNASSSSRAASPAKVNLHRRTGSRTISPSVESSGPPPTGRTLQTLLRRPSNMQSEASSMAGSRPPSSALQAARPASRTIAPTSNGARPPSSSEKEEPAVMARIHRRPSIATKAQIPASPSPPPPPRSPSPLLSTHSPLDAPDDFPDTEDEPPAKVAPAPAPARRLESLPSSPVVDAKGESLKDKDAKIQTLTSSLKVLSTRHQASLAEITSLQQKVASAESFIAARPKLTQKLQQLQSELTSTRTLLQEAETQQKTMENRLVDLSERLEMEMLERELCEEREETAIEEREELRRKLGEIEAELTMLQEEQVKLEGGITDETEGDKDPEQMSKATRRQIYTLEKQNERLKEVLARLRDSSQEMESEQRQRIAELERELSGVDELHNQFDSTLAKLQSAENQIEELKSQLDDALGAEEILVQLTEKNLALADKNEDLRLTIEELEQLKELADELEEHHVDTERTLEEEIAHKDVQLHEMQRQISNLKDEMGDYDGTIGQFRELVSSLQSDLEAHRTLSQTAMTERESQASQAASLLSLNLKLQSSAVKTRTRNLDGELLALEASQAKDLLNIIQPYLPPAYVETDSDSTNCYLFFSRLGRKCEILSSIVAKIVGVEEVLWGTTGGGTSVAENTRGEVTEAIVGICEMRTRVNHLSVLCRRFAAVLRRADVETFIQMGRLYPELSPLERRIDMHIDLIRRDEFREAECVMDLDRLLSQFEHIAETYFTGFVGDIGERGLDMAQSLDCDLDMFAAATGLTKTALQKMPKSDPDVARAIEEEGADLDEVIFEPLQTLLDNCRGAKLLTRKLVKRFEDLIGDSGALKDNIFPKLGALNSKVSVAVDFGVQLAQGVGAYLADVRASKEQFSYIRILSFVREVNQSTSTVRSDGDSVWNGISETLSLLVREIAAFVPMAMETENVIKVTGTAPWILRIAEIKSQMAVNVESDRKAIQLNEEIQDLARGIRTREQTLQESSVKIELMERRLEGAKKQADTILELENELAKARKNEKLLDQQVLQAQEEANQLRNDVAKLQAAAAAGNEKKKSTSAMEIPAIALEGNLETSYLVEQIEALRGTVRFLRSENNYIKSQGLIREFKSLPPLRTVPKAPPTPPPESELRRKRSGLPNGNADDSDSDDSLTERSRPTPKSLAIESKLLYKDYIDFANSARVVDLSTFQPKKSDPSSGNADGTSKALRPWMRRKEMPSYQIEQRKVKREALSRRVRELLDRAVNAGVVDMKSGQDTRPILQESKSK